MLKAAVMFYGWIAENDFHTLLKAFCVHMGKYKFDLNDDENVKYI